MSASIRLSILFVVICTLFSYPLAAQNPVVIGNARFSFINSGLVRLEYALEGKFTDDSTLFAVNREITYHDLQLTDKGNNRYTLTTPLMRIEYFDNGFPFGQQNLRVYFQHQGKEKSWLISHENKHGNLGGAITTLDGIRSPVELQEGLLSREGWYAIRDTHAPLLKNGWLENRDPNHLQDIYLFIYGDDYKFALKSLQTISGSVPMTRKYVHGSWYCRWWNYTDEDYRQLVREYKEHHFPLDIMVFDMGWHTQKEARVGTGHAGNTGWTGYTWNRKLIPDPDKLIQEFKDDDIQVVLNEHPHDGLRDHEDRYPAFMQAMNVDTAGQKNLLFDAGNKHYMEHFLHHAHGEADAMGIAFWWLDWQQDYIYPQVKGFNITHLPWLNHLYYQYSQQNGLRGAGFSRWAGWGDHRHPIQFSGDAAGNWEMLKFEIKLTATSGNAGCFFWAHDIGGFFDGKDPELYTRWTQFGLLNSSLRIHSIYDKDLDRRPWLWGEEYERAMRTIYEMRSQLMPYIYSSVWQCHTDMIPLNRSMYIDYNTQREAYLHPQEFMFGDLLLGAPVTSPRDSVTQFAQQTVWFPENEIWYNLFTGERVNGGQTLSVSSPLNQFPLFVKGGYPLPMQAFTERMTSAPLSTLIIRTYPGKDGEANTYTLHEDDGISMDYAQGAFASTKITYQQNGKRIHITVFPAEGQYKGQVAKRAYRFELPEIPASSVTAKVNGKKVKPIKDEALRGYVIEVAARDIRERVVLEVS
ncbi:MAG: Oligosaccharide 4-alpha-D-glucosyltransferase [Candidatus Ordinivivax streblomastigis]|uniref:Oligosaccharide 4-alpha-D-glucosyltransferase n=1 Tax=Candidatus Ordinivivax streblomastigis TaxID=2540710 RepID=A0A5M8NZ09_9BACT|nr:MAG: Oligosaccharide 4-alpha-D-glucosyltransferase [Candidatus Ordinivivax streblomastigis]